VGTDEPIQAFYVDLGLRIKRGRQQVHVSQADLALRLGLTRASIANVEAGRQRPAAHQVAMLADILGVPLEDLMPTAPSTLDESRDPIERQHAELHALAREWASAAT
jgi:transcriptional regulator with XRE-family HTH domain